MQGVKLSSAFKYQVTQNKLLNLTRKLGIKVPSLRGSCKG